MPCIAAGDESSWTSYKEGDRISLGIKSQIGPASHDGLRTVPATHKSHLTTAKMRDSVGCLFALLSPLATVVTASRIVLSNDDGWAESNVRSFYTALKGSRHEVVLSCPAENKSGTGMCLCDFTRQTMV
jgi:hypothetical protein